MAAVVEEAEGAGGLLGGDVRRELLAERGFEDLAGGGTGKLLRYEPDIFGDSVLREQ